MFLGARLSSGVVFSRPRRSLRVVFFVVIAFLVVSTIAAVLWFMHPTPVLLSEMPDDAAWYVSISTPHQKRWYDIILFWESGSMLQSSSARLYQAIDIVSWDDDSFAQNILPLFSGMIEIGEVKNSVVLRVHLRDAGQWLAMRGMNAGLYDGSVEPVSISGQTLLAQTSGTTDFYWQVRDGALYLSNDPDFSNVLVSESTRSMSFSIPYTGVLGSGIASAYIADKTALRHPFDAFNQWLPQGVAYPLALAIKSRGSSWEWQLYHSGGENSDKTRLITYPILRSDTYFASFQFSSASSLLEAWRSLSSSSSYAENSAAIESIASGLYGLDSDAFAEHVGARDISLAVYTPDEDGAYQWFYRISATDTEPDQTILDDLKKIGASQFAISHPIRVERTLSDKTIMVEMRAEKDDLLWEQVDWNSNGRSFPLYALRGNGEEQGQFVGYVAGVGYVGGTSLSVLDRELSHIQELSVSDKGEEVCAAKYPVSNYASLSGAMLFSDPFMVNVVKDIEIASRENGELVGCVLF